MNNIPELLLYCPSCRRLVEPKETEGYESGPFPTAYETYLNCPICGDDLDYELNADPFTTPANGRVYDPESSNYNE